MRTTKTRHGAALLATAALLAAGTTALAGPPLLCPVVVLTDTELENLEKAAMSVEGKAARAEAVVDALMASSTPRFRIEGIRWAFRDGDIDFDAVHMAFVRRVGDLGGKASPQDRFDLALSTVIADRRGEEAEAAAALLCEIADETGDPARLLIAAEALDLVIESKSGTEHRLASLLALAHCRRAAAAVADPENDEERAVARLIHAHLPYLKGMHSREGMWRRFIEGLEATKPPTEVGAQAD